jgi:hypothetical protein
MEPPRGGAELAYPRRGGNDLELTADEYTALDEASRPDPGYPYRMINSFGARSF